MTLETKPSFTVRTYAGAVVLGVVLGIASLVLRGVGSVVPWQNHTTDVVSSPRPTTTTTTTTTPSPLTQARALVPPPVVSTTGGEVKDVEFWQTHASLLQEAWHEWAMTSTTTNHSNLSSSLQHPQDMIHPELYDRIQELWNRPSRVLEEELVTGRVSDHNDQNATEETRPALFHEPIPGVWVCPQFLSPSGIVAIRQHLAAVQASGIPTRRPNGMNRYGVVLDPSGETHGAVQYPAMDAFQNWLVDEYVRPLGRRFFPEYIGRDGQDDVMSYAFTIQYQAAEQENGKDDKGNSNTNSTDDDTHRDVKLLEHSDASVITMNINLNLPSDGPIEGSSLLFLDPNEDKKEQPQQRHALSMTTPGMAVLHRGMHRHQALPIEKGQRHQLIVWLFGTNGYVRVAPYDPQDQMTVEERWSRTRSRSKVSSNSDDQRNYPFLPSVRPTAESDTNDGPPPDL